MVGDKYLSIQEKRTKTVMTAKSNIITHMKQKCSCEHFWKLYYTTGDTYITASNNAQTNIRVIASRIGNMNGLGTFVRSEKMDAEIARKELRDEAMNLIKELEDKDKEEEMTFVTDNNSVLVPSEETQLEMNRKKLLHHIDVIENDLIEKLLTKTRIFRALTESIDGIEEYTHLIAYAEMIQKRSYDIIDALDQYIATINMQH